MLPSAAALTWTVEPAFRTTVATIQHEPLRLKMDDFTDIEKNTELKRQLQKHFLDYNIYIPLEDIVTLSPQTDQIMMKDIMARSCGPAYVYVWTPLGFRLPFIGMKFIDRCWKPDTEIVGAS